MSLLDYARATHRLALQLHNHYVYLQVSAEGVATFIERWEESEEVAEEYAAFKKSLKAFACLLREAVSSALAASKKLDPEDYAEHMPEEADDALDKVGEALGAINAFFEEQEELGGPEEKPGFLSRFFTRDDDEEEESWSTNQEDKRKIFSHLFSRTQSYDNLDADKKNLFARMFSRDKDRDQYSVSSGNRRSALKDAFRYMFTGHEDENAPNDGETPLSRLFIRKERDSRQEFNDETWGSKPSLLSRIFPQDENKAAFKELRQDFDRAVGDFRVYMDLRHGRVLRKMSKRAKKMTEDVTELMRRLDRMVLTHSPEEQQKYMSEIDLRLMHRRELSPAPTDPALLSAQMGAYLDLIDQGIERRLQLTLEPYMAQQHHMMLQLGSGGHGMELQRGNELAVARAELADVKKMIYMIVQHLAGLEQRGRTDWQAPMFRLIEHMAAKVDGLLLTNEERVESQRQTQALLGDLSHHVRALGTPRPVAAYPPITAPGVNPRSPFARQRSWFGENRLADPRTFGCASASRSSYFWYGIAVRSDARA